MNMRRVVRDKPRAAPAKKPAKRCAIDGCNKAIKAEYLMCAAHWGLVSWPTQRAVYRAIERYYKADGSATALEQLREAQQKAVDEAKAKLGATCDG